MALLTQVDTETLSNQDISAALLVSTFTNTTRIRKVYCNVFLDQIAGSGAYTCYITVQRAGAGSAYETIRTTKDVGVVTAIVFQSMAITLNATDVMKVYVVGLAGDTTTVDIICDVNEEWINIDASGNVLIGAAGSVALTESYAADGATATIPQLLYMLLAVLTEASASGTTLTAKKLDGAATAATFTLDDGTNPTSITRTT